VVGVVGCKDAVAVGEAGVGLRKLPVDCSVWKRTSPPDQRFEREGTSESQPGIAAAVNGWEGVGGAGFFFGVYVVARGEFDGHVVLLLDERPRCHGGLQDLREESRCSGDPKEMCLGYVYKNMHLHVRSVRPKGGVLLRVIAEEVSQSTAMARPSTCSTLALASSAIAYLLPGPGSKRLRRVVIDGGG